MYKGYHSLQKNARFYFETQIMNKKKKKMREGTANKTIRFNAV